MAGSAMVVYLFTAEPAVVLLQRERLWNAGIASNTDLMIIG